MSLVTALNTFYLNQVLNTVLLLFLIVLYIGTAATNRHDCALHECYFSRFILFYAAYLLTHLVFFPLEARFGNSIATNLLSVFRVLMSAVAFSYAGVWVFAIPSETHPISTWYSKLLHIGFLPYYFLMLVLYWATNDCILANIPVVLYYFSYLAGLLVYRKSFDRGTFLLLFFFILPMLFLALQGWWADTPAHIYCILMMFLFYTRIWRRRQTEFWETKHQLVVQDAELAEARIALTTQQINPHFLNNSLSALAALCDTNPAAAKSLALEFAEYLRGCTKALSDATPIPFPEELAHTEHYLAIEQVRFGDKLSILFDLEETAFSLPPITLQPLVENALQHGLLPNGGGTVRIESFSRDDTVVVRVSDDGVGFDTEAEIDPKDHIGIENIQARLALLCGGCLSIDSDPGSGTCVEIILPKEEDTSCES